MTFTRAAAALLSAVLVFAARAADAQPLVVISLAQVSVAVAADGSEHLASLAGDVPVSHGTVIRYTVSAKDTGSEPARRLVLTGRVPAGTTYLPSGLHAAGGRAEFSLDGKLFAARPMVAVKTPAGEVMQPADPAQYVMVRWLKEAPLDAQASAAFSYQVQVK